MSYYYRLCKNNTGNYNILYYKYNYNSKSLHELIDKFLDYEKYNKVFLKNNFKSIIDIITLDYYIYRYKKPFSTNHLDSWNNWLIVNFKKHRDISIFYQQLLFKYINNTKIYYWL